MSGMRTNLALLAGIGLLVAAHWSMDKHTERAPEALRAPTLAPRAGKAATFSVARPGEPVTRLTHDGGWKIVAPYAANADASAVLRLADALAYAPIDEEMSDAELLRLGRTREHFGLTQPRVVVTIDDAVEVAFGASTAAGDGVYACVGKVPTVYVVGTNVFAAVNGGVEAFRKRRIFGFDADDVTAFTVRSGAGRFARVMRDGETWKVIEPTEGVASGTRVKAFLDELRGLEAQSFVWPAGTTNEATVASASLLAGYGLDPESSVTVTLMGSVGKQGAVTFGREAGAGLVHALVQDGSAIVTVPSVVRDHALLGVNVFADPRIFPIEASQVTAISVQDEDTAYLLSRTAEMPWHLDAPVSAMADEGAVEALVQRMLALKTSDVVTNGGVRVSVATNAAPVSVARKALMDGWSPEDLRSKEILKIDPKTVKRLVITDTGAPSVSLVRDAESGVWTIESAGEAVSVDCAAADKLVASLAPLVATKIVRLKLSVSEMAGYGLGKPYRTIAIDQTVEGSVRRNILIGDETEGCRYATVGSSDAVFVVSGEEAKTLLAPLAR